MSNQFFLRSEYTTQEMIQRIPSAQIRPGNDDFDRIMRDYGLEPSELEGIGKTDFIERINVEFTEEEIEALILDLFDSCGQKGDKFNIQVFSLPPNRSYGSLFEEAQSWEETELSDHFSILDHALYLDEVSTDQILIQNEDQTTTVIDLAFKTREQVDDIEPTEDLPIRIIRADTGELEASYSNGYRIEAPSRDRIEARVYTDSKMVAVSNGGGINQGIQSDVVNLVTQFGEAEA